MEGAHPRQLPKIFTAKTDATANSKNNNNSSGNNEKNNNNQRTHQRQLRSLRTKVVPSGAKEVEMKSAENSMSRGGGSKGDRGVRQGVIRGRGGGVE